MTGDRQLKPIPGFPGYFACDGGGIWVSSPHPAWRQGRLRRLRPTSEGRCVVVHMYEETGRHICRRVARLVYAAWFGPVPQGYVAACIDGNRLNTKPSNLVLRTYSEHRRIFAENQKRKARAWLR